MGNKNDNPPKGNIYLIAFMSVSILFVSIIWESSLDDTSYKFVENLVFLLKSIGSTGVAATVLGLIFNIPSFTKYINRSLISSLTSKEYIKDLKEPELKSLRAETLHNIYTKDNYKSDTSLIELDDQICNLLSLSYIEQYDLDIFCKIHPDIDNSFLKRVTSKVKFINPTKDKKCIKSLLEKSIWFHNIDGVDSVNLRKINSIKVILDDTEILVNEDNYKEISVPEVSSLNEGTGYKTKLTVNVNESLSTEYNDYAIIEIDEERITPISDINYIFRTGSPTKAFNFTYSIENMEYDIFGNLFGTLIKKKDYSIVKDSNSLYIRCNKWMLNGNGVVVTLIPKH